MASKTINTILNLKDNMSGALVKTSKKVNGVTKDMQRASKQAVNMANRFTTVANKMAKKAGEFAKIGAKMATAVGIASGVALIKQSDSYASIQARLKLINDGQQTVAQFNQKIFKTANAVRTSYQDVADIVGKLGITAGDAFKNNDEILKFSELMSKSFKIGGASAEEQSAAMYQLTQAMASGKLQGDEFRSISENAPLLAKAIAGEMGVSMGKLKEMSSEGKITSDVIKSALFNSTETINKQFSEMPMTFSEAIEKIKNLLTEKLQPTFSKISKWLNSKSGETAISKIGDGIAKLAGKVPPIINALQKVFDFAKKIFSFIKKYQDIIVFVGSFVLSLGTIVVIMGKLAKTVKAFKTIALMTKGVLSLTTFGIVALSISALIAVGVLLWKNWDKIKEKLKAFAQYIVSEFLAIKNKITETVSKVIDFISSVFPNLGESIKARIEAIKQIFSGLITFITGVFSGDWSKAWEGIKEIFAGIFNRLASILLAPFNLAIDIINKIIDKINGISFDMPDWLPDWLGGGKTLSVDIPKIGGIDIPKFATGTQYFKGGLANINEHGGEIVNLPNGSKVIPSDKSSKMLGGVNIAKLADTIIVREEADIDKIANALARKLNSAAVNLA